MSQNALNRGCLCPRLRPCMVTNVVPIEAKGYDKSVQFLSIGSRAETEDDLKGKQSLTKDESSSVSLSEESSIGISSSLEDRHTRRPESERKTKNFMDWFNVFSDGKKPIWENWGRRNNSNGSRALFPTQEATGGVLKTFRFGDQTNRKDFNAPGIEEDENAKDSSNIREQMLNTSESKKEQTKHYFPSWSTWKDWKKISIDLYLRLTDNPRNSRVRLKQTLALLPIAKIKPVIDFGYNGPNQSPISMRLDLKFLDCVKYMIQPDGNSVLQVRARAPLSDPRFEMDVIYEREMRSIRDTVKISFRALDIGFLKAPGFGFGFKFPLRFNNGVKITVGTKKYFGNASDSQHVVNKEPSVQDENQNTRRRKALKTVPRSHQTSSSRKKQWFHIHGPTKIDVKVRCLEYR